MKAIKGFFIFFIFILLATGLCVLYAFKIEPYRLKVREYTLSSDRESPAGIKIIQFSDLHIKKDFTSENLEKVVRSINSQEPDIVLFTGDLYDNYAVYHEDENIIKQFSSIKTRYSKIAVWGNRDYGGGAAQQYENIMEQSGFTLLKNETLSVSLENGKNIIFTGLDDSMLGNPAAAGISETSGADYSILMTHEPDTAVEFLDLGYDLMLSGHSHGGQVNIPIFPRINETALSVTSLASEYSSGMYELYSDSPSRLYVNTGIGTTHISARFGVIPEIAVFCL